MTGPDGEPAEVSPSEDISITEDITEEMKVQPGLFAWYASCAERAQARMKKTMYRIHCLEEDMDAEIRARGDKPTEKAIEREINRHPKMRKLYENYIDAKAEYGQLNALVEAFKQRAFILGGIGANYRAEGMEVHTLRAKSERVFTKRNK